jgi:hypothetical protein
MSAGRSITVTIDPMGNPKVEANNFHGVGCEDATRPIEEALAGKNISFDRVLKPEHNATEGQQEQVRAW